MDNIKAPSPAIWISKNWIIKHIVEEKNKDHVIRSIVYHAMLDEMLKACNLELDKFKELCTPISTYEINEEKNIAISLDLSCSWYDLIDLTKVIGDSIG